MVWCGTENQPIDLVLFKYFLLSIPTSDLFNNFFFLFRCIGFCTGFFCVKKHGRYFLVVEYLVIPLKLIS